MTTYSNIWITGASKGIGASLSEFYAKPGVCLGLVSNEKERLEATAARCMDKGAVVYTYAADVRDAARLDECASDFQSRAKPVDLVIANAGIRIEEDTEYNARSVPVQLMGVNYFGVINTIVPFIEEMKKRRSGHLVIISSIAAYRGTPNSGAYSASKAAIGLWAESLRLRLKPYRIYVSVVVPGFIKTEMNDGLGFWMPGLMSTADAARHITSAIRRRRRHVTFPWQTKTIWAVFRALPGPLYDSLILWAKNRQTGR